ncbi:hypothetical protein F5Y16DRAFT_416490 [Xylariaceae sp. FL0255]|nr:hypothetical protein F5Y16DRAFT_416490 [Xylariaceae sp. FL0255]
MTLRQQAPESFWEDNKDTDLHNVAQFALSVAAKHDRATSSRSEDTSSIRVGGYWQNPHGEDFPDEDAAQKPIDSPAKQPVTDLDLMRYLYEDMVQHKPKWRLRFEMLEEDDRALEYFEDSMRCWPTGNSLWIQREEFFFAAHEDIQKKDVFHARTENDLYDFIFASRSRRFQSQDIRPPEQARGNPTSRRCVRMKGYVLFVDKMPEHAIASVARTVPSGSAVGLSTDPGPMSLLPT